MLVNSAVLLYSNHCRRGSYKYSITGIKVSLVLLLVVLKGIIKGSYIYESLHDCYNILPALKQEVELDAHEFHLALVSSLMSKADAQ